MTEKKDRDRVMAEITLSHVLRLATEQDSPVSREQALAFLNQEGRAFEMWKQMMQAGEEFIARSLLRQCISPERAQPMVSRSSLCRPAEFVQQVNQTVREWINYYRHTNASDAFRSLQRFINTRFRRYLNYRSKGRSFGWKQYPNAATALTQQRQTAHLHPSQQVLPALHPTTDQKLH